MSISTLAECSVIYVDDEDSARELVQRLLRRYCKAVFTACDGVEGLALFKKTLADIVITDIEMPNMNGLELIDKIKEISPREPCVIISAYSDTRHQCEKASAQFIKPIMISQLKSAIERLVVSPPPPPNPVEEMGKDVSAAVGFAMPPRRDKPSKS